MNTTKRRDTLSAKEEYLNGASSCTIAKRLLSRLHSMRRQLISDRNLVHGTASATVTQHAKTRIANFYPLRVFKPIADVLIAKGFLSNVRLFSEIDKVNNKDDFRTSLFNARRMHEMQTNPVLPASALNLTVRLALTLLYGERPPVVQPELRSDQLLSLVNWKANSGFPHLTRKENLRSEYSGLLNKWLSGQMSLSEYLNLPLAVFNRVQAKNGELKRRIVFGYPFIFTIIEQVFFSPLIALSAQDRVLVIGKTQRQISEKVHSLKPFYTYSIDYSKFDLSVDPFWIYLIFSLFEQVLVLSDFQRRELAIIRKYFAFSKVYHPETGVYNRFRGVPSGSGGTNLIDSYINLFCTLFAIVMSKQADKLETLLIHGDDVVLASKKPLNIDKLATELTKLGMTIKEDESHRSSPGVSTVHFLGSLWIDGKPQRDVLTMSLQCSTISGFLERVDSLEDAVQGRIYTIFGYDSRLPYFWRKLGFPSYVGRRMAVYTEGLSFATLPTGPPPPVQYVTGRVDEWSFR